MFANVQGIFTGWLTIPKTSSLDIELQLAVEGNSYVTNGGRQVREASFNLGVKPLLHASADGRVDLEIVNVECGKVLAKLALYLDR